MELGAFSVSLAVRDLQISREFYEKLGFTVAGGDPEQHWLIMRNGATTLGLFQGMFESNILTFNPGWDSEGNALESFTDVRELQGSLKAAGLKPAPETDESSAGPAHFALTDPDGNTILFDQHR